jgi:hypothetical protein
VSCCIESLEEVQSTISEAAKRNMKDPKKIFAAMKKSVDALDRTKTFYKMIRCKVDHVVQEAIKRSVETITAATAAYRSTYDTSTPGRTEQYASYYPIFGEAAGIDTKHAGSNMPYQTKVVRYIVDITMWGVTELREIHTEYEAKTALFEMMVAFEPKAAELIWPETAKKKNKRTPPSLSGKKRQLSETDSDDAPSMMSDALSKRMSTSAIEGPQGSPAAVHEAVAQQPSNPHMGGVAPSTSMRPGPYQGVMSQSSGGFDKQITTMVSLHTPEYGWIGSGPITLTPNSPIAAPFHGPVTALVTFPGQVNPTIPTPTTTPCMTHGNPVGEPSYHLLSGGEMEHSYQVTAPLETFRIQSRQTVQPMVDTTGASGYHGMQPVSTNRALGFPGSAWSNTATTVTPTNGITPCHSARCATATHVASMDSCTSFSPLSLSPGPAQANSYQTNPEPLKGEMTYDIYNHDLSSYDSPREFPCSGLKIDGTEPLELDDDLLHEIRCEV